MSGPPAESFLVENGLDLEMKSSTTFKSFELCFVFGGIHLSGVV